MNTIKYKTSNWVLTLGATIFFAMLLSGCQRGMDISDEELVKRMNECHKPGTKTPAMAVMCGNYKDECMRRGKRLAIISVGN